MFVGDYKFGRLYHFELNENRTELVLDGTLNDKVADSDIELKDVIFADGFNSITDMEVGPDGYLYILSMSEGKIFRIVPEHNDD
jgi:glucose/arabinose dehydrogenase